MGFWPAGVGDHQGTAVSPHTQNAGVIHAVGEPEASQTAEDDLPQEEASEVIVPRVVPDVITPSQKERDEHDVLHLPFRNWCKHCVKGKSTERNFTATEPA